MYPWKVAARASLALEAANPWRSYLNRSQRSFSSQKLAPCRDLPTFGTRQSNLLILGICTFALTRYQIGVSIPLTGSLLHPFLSVSFCNGASKGSLVEISNALLLSFYLDLPNFASGEPRVEAD
jgi:hypothetical protein